MEGGRERQREERSGREGDGAAGVEGDGARGRGVGTERERRKEGGR